MLSLQLDNEKLKTAFLDISNDFISELRNSKSINKDTPEEKMIWMVYILYISLKTVYWQVLPNAALVK